MSVDVPFKTPLEVSKAIALLEAKFKDRYTEKDPAYSRVVNGGQRWRNVPEMRPWPPPRPRPRPRGGGRRHGHYDNRDYRDRRYHPYRRPPRGSPQPNYPLYPDHWSPGNERPHHSPPTHSERPHHHSPPPHYEHPHHHSPPPHYEHPHHHSPPPHYERPHHHPSPPHYDHSHHHPSPPHYDHPHHHPSPPHSPHQQPQERDDPPRSLSLPSTPPPGPPTPSGLVSTEESDLNPLEFESEVQKKTARLDIKTLGNLGNTEAKPLTTESDFNDILSMAQVGHTVSSLKEAKHPAPHTKQKHGDKQLKQQKQRSRKEPSDASLSISHGTSVQVTPEELFKPSIRKRPLSRSSGNTSDSDTTVFNKPLTVSFKRHGIHPHKEKVLQSSAVSLVGSEGSNGTFGSRKSALSVLSEEFKETSCHTPGTSSNTMGISLSTASVLSSDFAQTPDPEPSFHGDALAKRQTEGGKKKKKKKNKKLKGDEEFVSKVIDDGTGVKLKFKLH